MKPLLLVALLLCPLMGAAFSLAKGQTPPATSASSLTQDPDPTPGADLHVTNLLSFNSNVLPHKDLALAGKKPAAAHAGNIPPGETIFYQDNFGRKGEFNGTSPDAKNTNGATWTVAKGPGTYTTTGDAVYDSNAGYDIAYLPVNGTSGVVLDGKHNFILSATLMPDYSKGSWMGISMNSTPVSSGQNVGVGLADLTFGDSVATAYFKGTTVQYCCVDNTRHLIEPGKKGPFIISMMYHAKSGSITYSILGVVIGVSPDIKPGQIAALSSIALGNGNSGPTAVISNFTLGVGGSD
jgi:hypothetical protein